jgi:hypothetical protein
MGNPTVSKHAILTLINRRFICVSSGLLCLLAVGCSSSGDDDASGGGSKAGAGGSSHQGGSGGSTKTTTGDKNAVIGTFQVKLVAPVEATVGATSVIGTVYDRPSKEVPAWDKEGSADGDCQLFVPRQPFCDPDCTGKNEQCVSEPNTTVSTCETKPAEQSVGAVTVKGLRNQSGATELTLDFIANNYQPIGASLPYPACSEGDDVTLSAAGSSFVSGFSLATKCVVPVGTGFLNDSISIEDKDLTLTWTAPTQSGISKIYIKLEIAHHGGQKGKIECNTEDTGTLTIPASMIKSLKALGVAGFPSIVLRRTATASTTTSVGQIKLVVSSENERFVTIPGLTSCNDKIPCPTGQTCQTNLSCK